MIHCGNKNLCVSYNSVQLTRMNYLTSHDRYFCFDWCWQIFHGIHTLPFHFFLHLPFNSVWLAISRKEGFYLRQSLGFFLSWAGVGHRMAVAGRWPKVWNTWQVHSLWRDSAKDLYQWTNRSCYGWTSTTFGQGSRTLHSVRSWLDSFRSSCRPACSECLCVCPSSYEPPGRQLPQEVNKMLADLWN